MPCHGPLPSSILFSHVHDLCIFDFLSQYVILSYTVMSIILRSMCVCSAGRVPICLRCVSLLNLISKPYVIAERTHECLFKLIRSEPEPPSLVEVVVIILVCIQTKIICKIL